MTTRDDARRRGDVRVDPTRAAVTAEPAPSLPERLLAARERKGVDLYRAERDTKIRARYLGALERGDYRELPGSVYTKGFLRNYALYLGLDPDDILLQWHRERGDATTISEPVIVVPRPLQAPRQSLTFSPAVVVAALMTFVLILFAGYLGVQVLRFSKPPTVSVTDPPAAVSEVDDARTSYTLRGTSIAGATITVADAGGHSIQVTAQDDGTWNQTVDLRRGKNEFRVTATDPATGKQTEQPAIVVITVPFTVVQAPTLTVDSPAEGATYENGAIPIQGSATNATSVTVSAAYVGPSVVGSKAAPPPVPSPATVPVAGDGTFSGAFQLTAGRWTVTVAAVSAENRTTAITRSVTVTYKGVNLVVAIKGSRAWIKVWVDGIIEPTVGPAGRVYPDGKVLTFAGAQTIEVRTGSSGSTFFTLNGTSLGHLGASGIPETWLFAPTGQPKQTPHQ